MTQQGSVPLRMSTLEQEGPYQASKWLSTQVLLSLSEMQELLSQFPALAIFCGSTVTERGQGTISNREFLLAYGAYIDALQKGDLAEEALYRTRFYDMWTLEPDAVYAIPIGDDRQLIKTSLPLVQLQAHSLGYSRVDGKIRPNVVGSASVTWGLQFSFPQIFQDNATHSIQQVTDAANFPNVALYRGIQRWLRHHSEPTPFELGDTLVRVPIRLGKECFSWINKHPQLHQHGISVRT